MCAHHIKSFAEGISHSVDMNFELVAAVLLLVSSTCSDSPRKSCGPNEVRRNCTSECPPTCKNPNPITITCIPLCEDACFCKVGYLRDDCTKKCIPFYRCPKPSLQ